MTDTPAPQTAVTDLSGLAPDVVPNDDADPELVMIGERYWALAGFDEEKPVWCEKVKDIDTSGWGHQVYAVAAAGVRAVVAGRQCSSCGGTLSLTSRAAFQQVCDGGAPACVECTPSLLDVVRVVTDPARKAKREAAQAAAKHRQALDESRARWRRLQEETVEATYAVDFPAEAPAPTDAGVREQIAALALLRYAPRAAPIDRVGDWPDPLHPNRSKVGSLLGALVRADLVRIDPSSPASAFVWEPEDCEAALREAGGDLEALPAPQLTGTFYPLRACYYVPHGPSAGKAAELVDAQLAAALHPSALTESGHRDLLDVARELVAGEALRYFTARLDELHLPAVPDNNAARLDDAVVKVAEHRPLGEIYCLVWQATRAAAEAAQKNPRAPRPHMSTHAVNQIESLAQRAVADPDWAVRSFSEVRGQGLAAMTRTLFYTIFDTDPLTTSIPDLDQALPVPAPEKPGVPQQAPAPAAGDSDYDLPSLIAWCHAHPDRWDPDDVLDTLAHWREDLPQHRPDWSFDALIVARGAGHLQRLHQRLAPAIGARHAVLAVLAATDMLVHPVTDPQCVAATNGDWLFRQLGALLLGVTHDDTEGT